MLVYVKLQYTIDLLQKWNSSLRQYQTTVGPINNGILWTIILDQSVDIITNKALMSFISKNVY